MSYHTHLDGVEERGSVAVAAELRRLDKFADAARIADAADRLLRSEGNPQLRNIHCDCKDGTLMLWGSVKDHEQKQQAREMVQKLPGVTFVVDVVTIDP